MKHLKKILHDKRTQKKKHDFYEKRIGRFSSIDQLKKEKNDFPVVHPINIRT